MLIGALIGWGWGVPHFSAIAGDVTTAAATLAQKTWSTKVRFVGAGAIGVSAIWTLLKLVKPVASGLASAMAASRARKAARATRSQLPSATSQLVLSVSSRWGACCRLAGSSLISAMRAASARM